MNGITTTAGIPTGGGIGSKPAPERTEAKKPEAAPPAATPTKGWWDFYQPQAQAQKVEYPFDLDPSFGFEPFTLTERT